MNRRIRYPVYVLLALLIITFAIQPLLYHFFTEQKITELDYRLYYFSFNIVVTIVLGAIIYQEGKYNSGVQTVSGLIILNALMDVNRMYKFPDIAIMSDVITMFSGALILAFGLVSIKKAIFKKGAGILFVLIGTLYLIRFPMFIDLLYFYLKKYAFHTNLADGYYYGTLYLNYLLIFLSLISLDVVILENIEMSRYSKPKD